MTELYHNRITAKRPWFDVDIKGLWRYRDLYTMYIRRNIVILYKQTILGPLWYIIQPLFTTIIYMFVFGGLAGISTDGVPQPLFYLTGTALWSYFSTCFGDCNSVFSANSNVFSKVYFPRLVVPLASITTALLKMLIQMGIVVVVYLWYWHYKDLSVSPNITLFLFPLYILMVGFHALSWGLIISAWTTKYKDLNHLVGFAVQLLMYATPVIYPISTASETYQMILRLNPLTSIFEAFKYGCFGHGEFSIGWLLYSMAFLLVTLILSILVFNREEKRFVDTI